MALTRPAPGTWTYDDLLALPDDGRRWEIVEGELYEMPAPSWVHQTILFNLVMVLGPLVQAMGGVLRFAPLDVFFLGADPVQPDLLVLLPDSPARPSSRGLEGVPDLVVEVLSPSNRGHDVLTKRALYGRAGVREYWAVDPEGRTVEVFALDRDALHSVGIASGDATARSPLLPGLAIPLADLFAGIDAVAQE